MPIRSTALATQEYFHVFNRGNSKQVIFKDEADFLRLQHLLYLCNSSSPVSFKDAQKRKGGIFSTPRSEPLVAIGAYCLLPNHFHLLITPLVGDGVSQFMQKVTTAYVMYYNKRHNRSGSLFEGPFKAKHASSDRYLKYLFSYIHLNPLPKPKSTVPNLVPRPGLGTTDVGTNLESVSSYTYSSLRDYLGDPRDEAMIIDPVHFPAYVKTTTDWHNELSEWLSFDPDQYL